MDYNEENYMKQVPLGTATHDVDFKEENYMKQSATVGTVCHTHDVDFKKEKYMNLKQVLLWALPHMTWTSRKKIT